MGLSLRGTACRDWESQGPTGASQTWETGTYESLIAFLLSFPAEHILKDKGMKGISQSQINNKQGRR